MAPILHNCGLCCAGLEGRGLTTRNSMIIWVTKIKDGNWNRNAWYCATKEMVDQKNLQKKKKHQTQSLQLGSMACPTTSVQSATKGQLC